MRTEDKNRRWEYWLRLTDQKFQISNTFDKYLLTFSTGGLYLSVAFTSSLENLHNICYLKVGWAALTLTILAVLISFFLSERAYSHQVRQAIKLFKNKKVDDAFEKNPWNIYIASTRIVSIAAFVAGLIFLVLFYLSNLI